VQPPARTQRQTHVDHNIDRLVEDGAGYEAGLDPTPKRGLKATIWMIVERPTQRTDHVPQQLVFGEQTAPNRAILDRNGHFCVHSKSSKTCASRSLEKPISKPILPSPVILKSAGCTFLESSHMRSWLIASA